MQVANWRENIGSIMVEHDERPEFDIQKTGRSILSHAHALASSPSAELPFSQVLHCAEKFEVARGFSAFLQLVNNRNVDVRRGANPASPFFVSILNPLAAVTAA